LKEYAGSQMQKQTKDENFVEGLIDSAALNPVWRQEFQKSFNAHQKSLSSKS
jgi:enamine deaminase RidA (YjgF/YER057c/UK114 family)